VKIGFTLPQAAIDGDGGSWAGIRRLAVLADERGADSLWVCDHFLDRTHEREVGYHEPMTLLAAMAAVTSRVELGTLVASTSFRSPGLVAKLAATLDDVAGGRVLLGVGCGWHEPEYRAFGYPFDHRVGRFEEALVAIRGLLDGNRVTSAGRWWSLQDAVILPSPRRRVPIVVAAEGPRMLALAARHADGWQTAWYGLPDARFHSERGRFADACAAEGRTTRVEVLAGVEVLPGTSADPHLPLDPVAIADGLAAWSDAGVDHVQLGVHPGTMSSFTTALDGVRRFRDSATH
jgi:alkanesulfonate monooxygenase SsuD/methylene tetrahydromethanopterin reductase-like flavin-dependent oxidoreductase (luciferase family)